MAKKASAKQLAWRRKFAELYGRKKGSRSKGSSRGGGSMAKTSNGGSKKQGVVSWATSVIALVIGLSDVFARAADAAVGRFGGGSKMAQFGELIIADYTGLKVNLGADAWGVGSGYKWDYKQMVRGYAPIAGGIAFKKSTAYLTKTARVTSLIPRIG